MSGRPNVRSQKFFYVANLHLTSKCYINFIMQDWGRYLHVGLIAFISLVVVSQQMDGVKRSRRSLLSNTTVSHVALSKIQNTTESQMNKGTWT